MPVTTQTKPCDYCGKPVTKTGTQASQRKYWTCDQSCANKQRIRLGNTPNWPDNPLRGVRETRPCAQCGAPVTRYLNQRNADKPWCCSKSCRARMVGLRRVAEGSWERPQKPRRGDTVPCATCGKPFYRQPAFVKEGRKYCSRACNAIGQRKEPVVKACAVCGKEMRLPPSYGANVTCSMACQAIKKTTRHTGRVHNGRPVIEHQDGYFLIYEPEHPAAHKHNGRVLEHRWVVEQAIGRHLTKDEQVDHINRDKKDNRLENLQILSAHDHTIKTTADRMLDMQRLRDRIAEYERRFGPIAQRLVSYRRMDRPGWAAQARRWWRRLRRPGPPDTGSPAPGSPSRPAAPAAAPAGLGPGKMRRGYADKMLRPQADYQDKALAHRGY